METAIIGGLMKEVITSFGSFANNEIARVLGVEDEINKMRESLRSITFELNRSDWTTIIAHSETTIMPLKRLTDIAYEAENVIDRFKIKTSMLHTSQLQVTRHPMQSQASTMKQLLLKFQEWRGLPMCRGCKELDLRRDTAKRIEELNKRLQVMLASRELPRDLEALALRYRNGLGNRKTIIGPVYDEHEHTLVGSTISSDCNNHMKRLRRRRGAGGSIQVIFAIVGAPGVGKTAQARKIYHALRGQFATSLWVHVSSGTGTLAIWSGDNMDNIASSSEPAHQKEMIRQYLMRPNGSLLLVIDNMWDMDGWDFLLTQQRAFINNRGVRVVVTTPNWDIAKRMGVDTRSCCHRISTLDEDDGWELLWRMARLKDLDVRNFQDVGKRIVRKCSGIPLALEVVGCKLRLMDQVRDWETELSHDFIATYKDIRRSIDASYMDLEYRLKRCFLYCSLYPEGSVIEEKYIVQQWIAEGIIEGTQQHLDPEEEGRRCYAELVNRSLLQPAIDGSSCATMPTLLRSYAIYRSQDENYIGDNVRNIGGGDFKVWRLCATNIDTIRDIPEDITTLRTLMVFGSSSTQDDSTAGTIPASAISIICRKFTSLRVLDLRDTQVEAVSKRLGNLLQLRYLNLSNTRIRKLPRQVRNLVMLQFLILKNCRYLESLPSGIGRLKQLRSLDISGTPKLQEVQFRLFNLRELNSFQGFRSVSSAFTGTRSSSHGWTFMELNQLYNLTSLQILKLGGSTSSQEAAQLHLHDMVHLKELELCCITPVGQPSEADAAESIRGVLATLQPPQSLVSLKLANVYDSELPSWMSSNQLTALQRLTLEGCSRCQQLPALGGMKQLKFLAVAGFSALTEIDHELRGVPRQTVAFPRLEQLTVSEMENLQIWWGLEPRDMPMLGILQLSDCPKLTELPTWLQHCKALTSLKIQRAGELMRIKDLHHLKALQVGTCRALRRISNLGNLVDLKIAGCSHLNAVEAVPLLRSLHLHEHVVELPRWLHERKQQSPFPLRRLEIVGTEELLDNYSSQLAPHWPVMQGVADHVYAELHDGSVYFSYARGTGLLHRSPRCIERANICSAALGCAHQEAWMSWRLLYELFAALLLWGFALHYLVFM